MQELSSEEYKVGIIANPSMAALDFLKEIIYHLGIEKTVDTKPGLLHILNDAMLQNLNKRKKTVLIVDDAQAIEDIERHLKS